MVNQNQIEHARTLVQTSASLSPSERQEWLSLLSFMSDKQLLELCTVLESQPTPEPAPVAKRVKVTTGPKGLPQPPEELDLPAPQAYLSKPTMPAVQDKVPAKSTKAAEQNSVSAFINRNFAQTLHRTPGPVADIVPPVPAQRQAAQSQPVSVMSEPVPTPGVTSVAPAAMSTPVIPVASGTVQETAPVQPVWEEVVVRLKSLEDVRRLTVATLRAKGTEFLEEGLQSLGTRYGYFSVQLALEQSPLYQTYLSLGARVLQDRAQFESLQNELSAAGKPYLAKTEFEEMSDLLQRIKGG